MRGHVDKDPIAVIRIEGLPLMKSESKIVGTKNGIMQILDSPEYVESIVKAGLLGEELFIGRWTQLPIDEPIQITCEYHVTGRLHYNLAQCNAWILDLLHGLSIIKSKGRFVVINMDGSRFIKENGEPYVLITIRKTKGDSNE
jgi:hypothetical protein